jgi:hypothetical protein
VGEQGRVRNGEGITSKPAIVPEGGRGAITDVNESNRTISRQLLTNDSPKVGGGRGRVIRKHGVIEEKPILPGSLSTSEKLINKFEEHISILGLQILKPKTTIHLTSTDMLPGHKALGAVASIFSGPEESMTSPVNSLDHRFVEPHCSHIMQGDSTEDRGCKSEPTSSVQ